MTTDVLGTDIHTIAALDWDDLPTVAAASEKLLTTLDRDRALLGHLARNATADPVLADLCEHYDILDKIVLHDDPTGWRLRLHVFLPGYFDRPHNHRWTYASRILAGSYTHTLYDLDATATGSAEREADRDRRLSAAAELDLSGRLQATMTRTETAGDTYTLHHNVIHSVVAEPYTTTLIVRGPAVKDRFFLTDRVTGRSWWQYGAADESAREAADKRLPLPQLHARIAELTDQGVLA